MFHIELFEISKINLIRLAHLFSCLLGGLLILITWYSGRNKTDEEKRNWGLIYISFALLFWAAIDSYRLLESAPQGSVNIIVKTFSAYNNACFLASLPFFQYGFKWAKKYIPGFSTPSSWALSILLINLLVVLFYSLNWGESDRNPEIVKYFDVFYSVITMGVFSYAMVCFYWRQETVSRLFVIPAVMVSAILTFTQFAFLPFFQITHKDPITVSIFISQIGFIFLLLIFAKNWLTQLQIADMERALEKNTIQLQAALKKNEELTHEYATLLRKESSLVAELMNMRSFGITSQNIELLSDREVEVLKLVDKSYSEIATLLHISRDTVITHKKNIATKLGLSTKEDLIEFAVRNNLFPE